MQILNRCFWLVLFTVLVGCSGSSSNESYSAEITRTSFGVPHIKAQNFRGLGYGYGYAFSQDNYCELMKEVVRANGRSALLLGDEGNVDADVVYRFFNNDEYIENEFMAAAPRELDALVRLCRRHEPLSCRGRPRRDAARRSRLPRRGLGARGHTG